MGSFFLISPSFVQFFSRLFGELLMKLIFNRIFAPIWVVIFLCEINKVAMLRILCVVGKWWFSSSFRDIFERNKRRGFENVLIEWIIKRLKFKNFFFNSDSGLKLLRSMYGMIINDSRSFFDVLRNLIFTRILDWWLDFKSHHNCYQLLIWRFQKQKMFRFVQQWVIDDQINENTKRL